MSGEAPVTPSATRVSGRRYVAHLVDGVAFTVLFLLAFLLLTGLLAASPSGTAADVGIWAILVLGLTVGHVAYFVLQERRNGRTLGKRLVRIRVIDGDGGVPSTSALVKRTLPLLIEYFYIFALIAMMTSTYRQRFGDRWGDTYVVADD